MNPTRGKLTVVEGSTPDTASNVALAADLGRTFFLLQNISDTDIFLRFGAAAEGGAGDIKIAAGDAWENPPHFCPTGSANVKCASATKAYTIWHH